MMENQVYRIGILGDEGVGKTEVIISLCMLLVAMTLLFAALLVRFLCHRFLGEYDPTIEDKYRKTLCVDDTTVTLDILDTACRGSHSSKLRDQFLKEGDGFIVVYSITDRRSFQNIPLYKTIINGSRDLPDSSPISVALIANKLDLEELRSVSMEEGAAAAVKYGWIFAEASAVEYEAADSYIVDLVRDIMEKKAMSDIPTDIMTSLPARNRGDPASGFSNLKKRRNSLISLFSSHGAKFRTRLNSRRASCH